VARKPVLAIMPKIEEEKHSERIQCLPFLAAAVWPVPQGPPGAARGVLSDARSEGHRILVRVPRGASQGKSAAPLSGRPSLFEALKPLTVALLKARARLQGHKRSETSAAILAVWHEVLSPEFCYPGLLHRNDLKAMIVNLGNR
jgi:hypothetical protein